MGPLEKVTTTPCKAPTPRPGVPRRPNALTCLVVPLPCAAGQSAECTVQAAARNQARRIQIGGMVGAVVTPKQSVGFQQPCSVRLATSATKCWVTTETQRACSRRNRMQSSVFGLAGTMAGISATSPLSPMISRVSGGPRTRHNSAAPRRVVSQ